MILVYAFVGPLPSYSLETIHQARLFFDGDIYFIISDIENPLVETLKTKYSVHIVPYESVKDENFNHLISVTESKFCIVKTLKGRERLFIHAFERFFVLANLMKQKALSDVFFLELDNLMYNDPRLWEESFKKYDMSYMFDNYNRASSGICYVKNTDILNMYLDHNVIFILSTTEFVNEMTTLYTFWEQNQSRVGMLPTHWIDSSQPSQTYQEFNDYNSVFDALSMGIYLGGIDPHHSKGKLTLGLKSEWGLVDYTKYMYEWKMDEMGRKIPYVYNGSSWVRINNLHIHSKNLEACLSKAIF
jgi:hypothetical protein